MWCLSIPALTRATQKTNLQAEMEPWVFTTDDQVNPVVCLGCRELIPRAVFNSGLGYCPACIESRTEVQAELTQNAILAEHRKVKAMEAVADAGLHEDTGLGMCPYCRSKNVVESRRYRPGVLFLGFGVILAYLLFGEFGVIPAAIAVAVIIASLWNDPRLVTSRHCRYCGSRW